MTRDLTRSGVMADLAAELSYILVTTETVRVFALEPLRVVQFGSENGVPVGIQSDVKTRAVATR